MKQRLPWPNIYTNLPITFFETSEEKVKEALLRVVNTIRGLGLKIIRKQARRKESRYTPHKNHLAHFDKAVQREVISVLKRAHVCLKMLWRYLLQCIGIIPKFKLKCTYVSYILNRFRSNLMTVIARLCKRTLLYTGGLKQSLLGKGYRTDIAGTTAYFWSGFLICRCCVILV